MIKRTFGVLIVFLFLSAQARAVGEGVATTMAVKFQTAMQKAHHAVMETNAVKSIKVMYDNYVQSKLYYDSIREASQHRGGLMGYYSEIFTRRVRSAAQDEWWKMQKLKEGDPNNALRRIVESGESYVESRIDQSGDKIIDAMFKDSDETTRFADKMNDLGKARDKEFERLSQEMSKNDLTDRDIDKLHLKGIILQIEYLQAIDQGNRMTFVSEAKGLQRQYLLAKRNQVQTKGFFATMDQQIRDTKPVTKDKVFRALSTLPGEEAE
jgi:hypothetical protein